MGYLEKLLSNLRVWDLNGMPVYFPDLFIEIRTACRMCSGMSLYLLLLLELIQYPEKKLYGPER